MKNPYGHFSKDMLEFIVTDPNTPRPWINYLTNEDYCAVISHMAGGFSFFRDCRSDRLTRWIPEAYHFDRPGRYVFIRDENSKKAWSATYQPLRVKPSKFECRHGLGYTVLKTLTEGIEAEITFFVPRSETCELWWVRLTNRSPKSRKLTVVPYVEWLLGDYHLELRYRNIMNLYNRVQFDKESQAIFARKTASWGDLNIQSFPGEAFFASSLPVKGVCTHKDKFLGLYNTEENPEAILSGRWVQWPFTSGEDSIAALKHELTLARGQTKEFVVVLGQSDQTSLVRSLIKKYRNLETVADEFEQTRDAWRKRIVENVWVKTPDADFDTITNVWVKYQTYMCNFWSRSPSYFHEGSGGRGYRDSCQDAEGLLAVDPEHSAKKIRAIVQLIREDGSCAGGWSASRGPVSHRPNKDHPTWLTATVSAYIRETGDTSILFEKYSYVKDWWIQKATKIDPHWDKGSIQVGEGTVFEHLWKNLDFTFNDVGERGLPLIGHADWNDAIDAAGIKGKGESVWLAMALVRSLKMLAELAERIDKKEEADELRRRAEVMTDRINKVAWDGGWYVYGFTDYNEVYGSAKNKEGKVQMNTQSWAVLAGIAQGPRANQILEAVDKYCDGPHGRALFAPAYTSYDPHLGRITMFSEGTKENAAVFCHAATFCVVADCMAGRGDKAYEAMKKIMPNAQKDYKLYKTEPYAYAEYLVGPEHPYNYGEGAFTWITGTAGWTFMAATEWVLGARRDFEGLRVDPCLPSHWKSAFIRRPFRGAVYEIQIENPEGVEKGVAQVFVDGEPIEGNLIRPHGDGRTHQVRVVMGKRKFHKKEESKMVKAVTLCLFGLILAVGAPAGWADEEEWQDVNVSQATGTVAQNPAGYRAGGETTGGVVPTAPQEDVLLIADFEGHPNNLGGNVGVYGAGEPNWERTDIPYSWYYETTSPGYRPENVHSGVQCFRIVNGTGAKPNLQWASLGIDLGPITDATVTPVRVDSKDVSRYKYLSFWAKGENGGEHLKVLFRDSHALTYIPQYQYEVKVPPVTAEWQKYMVPLASVERYVDLRSLSHVGFSFGSDIGNKRGDILYVDDLAFVVE